MFTFANTLQTMRCPVSVLHAALLAAFLASLLVSSPVATASGTGGMREVSEEAASLRSSIAVSTGESSSHEDVLDKPCGDGGVGGDDESLCVEPVEVEDDDEDEAGFSEALDADEVLLGDPSLGVWCYSCPCRCQFCCNVAGPYFRTCRRRGRNVSCYGASDGNSAQKLRGSE